MNKKKRLGLTGLLMIFAFSLFALSVASGTGFTAYANTAEDADSAADDYLTQQGGKQSANSVSTLTVSVGYFGGPYIEKAMFYVDTNRKCLYYEDKDGNYVYLDGEYLQDIEYTFYDGQGQFYLDNAKVVTLEDFFDAAGIDINSIQYLHFMTADEKNPTFSWTTLTKADRFAFPKIKELGIQWDFQLEDAGVYDTVYLDRQIVPMGLAVEESWHSVGTDPDATTDNAVRFLYGQLTPYDGSGENDSDSNDNFKYWKWIYSMAVQLGGTPQTNVTIDLDDKLGSTYHVSVNLSVLQNGRVTDIDDAIAEQIMRTIKENLAGASTNREVLEVGNITDNGDGTLSVDVILTGADGTAQLKIGEGLSDGYQATVGVEVEDGIATVTSVKGNISGTAVGQQFDLSESAGSQSQDSSAQSQNDVSSVGNNSEIDNSSEAGGGDSSTAADSDASPDQQSNAEYSVTGETGVTQNAPNSSQNVESLDSSGERSETEMEEQDNIASDGSEVALVDSITQDTELAPEVNSIRISRLTIDSDEGGEQNWRETQMAEDAVAMGEVEQPDWLRQTIVLAVCMLALGAAVFYLRFRKQTVRQC